MLAELGHAVTEASSGAAALAPLQAGGLDLLLADFAMPGMNGAELAEAAKRLDPELPIVFMTGYAESDALRSWTVEGYCTVKKPFDLKSLAAGLHSTMRAAPVG